jgi:hypothetical protein
MRTICISILMAGVLSLAATGCQRPARSAYAPYTGPTSARPAENVGKVFPAVGRRINAHHLEQLGVIFIDYWITNPRGPSKVEDLGLDKDDGRQILKLVKDGELIIVWNVGENNTNCRILAYEKNTPTQGGLVLRRDGSVGQATAEEFAEYQKNFPPQK